MLAGRNKWCVLVQAKGPGTRWLEKDQRDPGCGVGMMASRHTDVCMVACMPLVVLLLQVQY